MDKISVPQDVSVFCFCCFLLFFKVAYAYTDEQLLVALQHLALQSFNIKEKITFYLHNGLKYAFHY